MDDGGMMITSTTPYTPVLAHYRRILDMRFIEDQDLLATIDDRGFALWKLPNMRLVARVDEFDGIVTASYQPATHELLLASLTMREISAVNVRTRRTITHRLGNTDQDGGVSFSANGSVVAFYTGTDKGKLREWRTPISEKQLDGCQETRWFSFSPDYAYVATSQGRNIVIWETLSGNQVASLNQKADCHCFLPDRSLVVAYQSNIVCYEYNRRHGAWNRRWIRNVSESVYDIIYSPQTSTRMPLIVCMSLHSVTLLDPTNGQPNGQWRSPSDDVGLSFVALAPHRNLAFAADSYGMVYVWDC